MTAFEFSEHAYREAGFRRCLFLREPSDPTRAPDTLAQALNETREVHAPIGAGVGNLM